MGVWRGGHRHASYGDEDDEDEVTWLKPRAAADDITDEECVADGWDAPRGDGAYWLREPDEGAEDPGSDLEVEEGAREPGALRLPP